MVLCEESKSIECWHVECYLGEPVVEDLCATKEDCQMFQRQVENAIEEANSDSAFDLNQSMTNECTSRFLPKFDLRSLVGVEYLHLVAAEDRRGHAHLGSSLSGSQGAGRHRC